MAQLHGDYALYFKSRKNFEDKKTWSKEKMPPDWSEEEVKQAAKAAKVEGYAVMNFDMNEVYCFKWFV